MDAGMKNTSPSPSLKAEWEDYRSCVRFRGDLHNNQAAFYAGDASLLRIQRESIEKMSDREFQLRMSSITNELEEYARKLMPKEAPNA